MDQNRKLMLYMGLATVVLLVIGIAISGGSNDNASGSNGRAEAPPTSTVAQAMEAMADNTPYYLNGYGEGVDGVDCENDHAEPSDSSSNGFDLYYRCTVHTGRAATEYDVQVFDVEADDRFQILSDAVDGDAPDLNSHYVGSYDSDG